jgi:hypothetical protein
MQIPKQPRTKSTAEQTSPESSASAQNGTPSSAQSANQQLQHDYSSYLSKVNASYLQAQLDQAKAYLTYLENLQERAVKPSSEASVEYWKEVLQAYGNTQAVADAQKKYALAHVDYQVTYQKALADAVTALSQATRDILEKLQKECTQHDQEIANSLKQVLLKIDVSTAQLPALSLLYQAIRTMSTTQPSESTKS